MTDRRKVDLSWCTPAQLTALERLKEQWGEDRIEVHSKEIFGPALLVEAWYETGGSIIIGIETDGYAHS